MFATAKIMGLSAVLSAAIVTAYEFPQARETAPAAAKYADRILPSGTATAPQMIAYAKPAPQASAREAAGETGKGDRLRLQMEDRCAAQTWPNISSDCVVAVNGASGRKPARTITIEERTGANSSALVRVPVADLAARR
jgi:hypothetical protein